MLPLNLGEVVDGLVPLPCVKARGSGGEEKLNRTLLVDQPGFPGLASASGQGQGDGQTRQGRGDPDFAKHGHHSLKGHERAPAPDR